MTEEFRPCVETYEISNFGNCRRKRKDGTYKEIKGSIDNGYRCLHLKRNGRIKHNKFHKMVMKAFVGDYPPDKPQIDHIDRNKLNNRLDNLRYCTHQENNRNVDTFRDDIKEEGIARINARKRDNNRQRKLSKKYYCSVCDIACGSPSVLNRHNNGYRHVLKCKWKIEMEKVGIEWTEENYILCKRDAYEFKRGRKPKPAVYVE